MRKKEKYEKVIAFFMNAYPNAETELLFKNGYELTVAVILSAQCTDKRVNLTTPALFQKFPDPLSLLNATETEVFSLIKSISYPNNKTKHLIGMAKMLVKKFNKNRIPRQVVY